MTLPYSSATSGQNAINEIQKIVKAFGCTKFATGSDFNTCELFVQFEHRGRMVHVSANAKGYAAAWLKENPYSNRKKCSKQQHESKALDVGNVAVYSILRDWVKGQITSVEIGMMTFEAAFLSHTMLPNGKKVIDEIQSQNLLPQIQDDAA